MSNRIWIELELSEVADDPINFERAEKATKMLRKLGVPEGYGFSYREDQRAYNYDEPCGYEELADNGKWFNLDFLSKD